MSIKKNKVLNHSFFIHLALIQAKKNLGNTGENPSVGCLIVKKNEIMGSSCTSLHGRPHAEVNAINLVKKDVKNSDLYVTMEPCSHYGETPPCVDKIIKSKIKKVYFSIKDPDLRSYNKSISKFQKKNILVKHGIETKKINYFYRSYKKYKNNTLPFVTAKIAASQDLFTKNKKKGWITNIFSRSRVHLIRSINDCVITSSRTVITDNPNLTCRLRGLENKSPVRVILDKKLKSPINSNIFKDTKHYPTIVFFNKFNKKKLNSLKALKIKLIWSKLSKDGNLDLINILVKLKQLGFSRIFLESGLELTTKFLSKNLVDDLHLFISSKKLKNNGGNSINKCIKFFLRNKRSVTEKVNLKGDKFITYKIK